MSLADVERMLDEIWALAYVRAVAFVLGSVIVAKLGDWIITRGVMRFARSARTPLDERVVELLSRPIFISVVLVGLNLATYELTFDEPYRFITKGIIQTLVIIVWTVAAIRLVGLVFRRMNESERVGWVNDRTLPLVSNGFKVIILGLTFYFLFLAWHINPSAWLASAGIIGITLGLAAQESLGNLFGGFSIMLDAPYKVGDFVVLAGGERGQVTQIGLRSTRILTREGVEITLPNSQIANAQITNESGGPAPKQRIHAEIGVAYGSDIDYVSDVLLDAAYSVEWITHDPEPRVRFMQFGDSSLVFHVMVWIDDPLYRLRCIDQLNRAIYKGLAEAGITIPFPQRDLWLKQWPATGSAAPPASDPTADGENGGSD